MLINHYDSISPGSESNPVKYLLRRKIKGSRTAFPPISPTLYATRYTLLPAPAAQFSVPTPWSLVPPFFTQALLALPLPLNLRTLDP